MPVLTPSAPNIQTLFVGELLCGLPWGAFSSVSVSTLQTQLSRFPENTR